MTDPVRPEDDKPPCCEGKGESYVCGCGCHDASRGVASNLHRLVMEWRKWADEMDVAAKCTCIAAPVQRLCAHELAAILAAAPVPCAASPADQTWEQRARQHLWLNHGCAFRDGIYGDDGEMQCNNMARHRPLDFKRESWDALSDEIFRAQVLRATGEGDDAVTGLPAVPVPPVAPVEELAAVAEAHHYVSTACQHQLHDRCRQTCKFCAVPCRCACHQSATVRVEE